MNINSTTGAGSTIPGAETGGQTTGVRNDGLGRDAFLMLLVEQLKHQDPSNPQDSSEFLSQLAQFTSVEKLTSMESTLIAINQRLESAANSAGSTQSDGGQ